MGPPYSVEAVGKCCLFGICRVSCALGANVETFAAQCLAQLQMPSKPVKASGSCGGRISKGSFSKLKGVRPGLPFASLFPKRLAKVCSGASLS